MMRTMPNGITIRALNRSLLARQGLLERVAVPVPELVERLVGMQAQIPGNPYVGLWSRLRAFAPAALSELVASGAVVRAQLMRSTIHLVTAADHDRLFAPMLPCQERHYASQWRKRMGGADLAAVIAAGRAHLAADGPLSRGELDRLLLAEFPGAEKGALAMAATLHLPGIQVPPRGEWNASALPRLAVREAAGGSEVGEIVRRYLAAFGPATVADIRTWSGLTGLRAVVDELDLVELDGGLLDVPDAPWPDADSPAPPRLLPEFDNALLAHADRARIVHRQVPMPAGGTRGTVLVDGFVAGAWVFTEGEVRTDVEGDDVAAEAAALADFLRS